ncbi:MAG: hydrogenase 3 maturation endopeptidase HyCI [Candidatus Omnitrophica bacterium]|nr:hydrogenase 3 maturation endopeptidase HyCI [Candidatus Omnitrophota bacterium]
MKDRLTQILKGKVVIIGIGNPLRADDAFGPVLIKRLQGKVKAVCIDAASTPENHTGKIIKEKPDTILLLDALHLGAVPGEWAILEKDEIVKSGFSTHDTSCHMFIEYLEQNTPAKIYMLGVEPKSIALGEPMSDEIEQALEQICQKIKETLNH